MKYLYPATRKIIRIATAVLLWMGLFTIAQAQSLRDPATYMNHIGDRYIDLSLQSYKLLSAIAHATDARATDPQRQELLRSARKIHEEVTRMPPFNDYYALRDSAAGYLQVYLDLLEKEYDNLLELQVVSSQSAEKMDAYMEAQRKARARLDATNTGMRLEQQRFADMNGLQLVERQGELYDKMQTANAALDHLQQVYLLFFGPQREEARMLQALANGDLEALMKSRNQLAALAIRNNAILMETGAFKDDASLVDVCREFNAFYVREAETATPIMVSYLQAKSAVAEARERIDESEGDPPSGYIEAYNEAVRAYNETARVYNAAVERFNLERSLYNDQWKAAFSAFLERHIPKF